MVPHAAVPAACLTEMPDHGFQQHMQLNRLGVSHVTLPDLSRLDIRPGRSYCTLWKPGQLHLCPVSQCDIDSAASGTRCEGR